MVTGKNIDPVVNAAKYRLDWKDPMEMKMGYHLTAAHYKKLLFKIVTSTDPTNAF